MNTTELYEIEFEYFMDWLMFINGSFEVCPLFERGNESKNWGKDNYKLFIQSLINVDWENEQWRDIKMYLESSISEYLDDVNHESRIFRLIKHPQSKMVADELFTKYFKEEFYALVFEHTIAEILEWSDY